jgi:hypothetical protein
LVASGDGGGEFAFGVVAVAVMHGPPVVDHGDDVGVDRDPVRVVGMGVEFGQVGLQPPLASLCAQLGEGGGVAVALGEEVAAEPAV